MANSSVSIAKTSQDPDYDEIRAKVENAVNLVGGIRDIVQPGQTVLINPSWVTTVTKREQAAITLPEVTRAVADIVKDAGAKAIIAESSAIGVDSEKVISESGYQELRDIGYEVIDLKQTQKTMIPIKDGKIFKEIESYKLVEEVDAIFSVPKLKTHDQMELTISIKNLKGLLSDKYKREFHQNGVFDACVDWFSALKPSLAIVDAIYCQEGLGPIFGKTIEMDLVLAGRDLVAVDAVCGYIAGFSPEEVAITREATVRGLGVSAREDIKVVGESIESVQRPFMRVLEDDRMKIEGFELLYGEATCTGCRMGVMSSIFDMKENNQMMYLDGITVVTGDPEIPEAVPKDGLVPVGRCVPKNKRNERYVKGCPPNNLDIVQAIIGDRDKAERRWE